VKEATKKERGGVKVLGSVRAIADPEPVKTT
jgi:hypothetical protein